ncbi:flavin-containing monooxygenase [Saccharopolyspora soli]|uniref:flavin-containing monooxygenase n=1 Tax=Saccharopolyspora soli TaxID=2926618 RepID=UPI001F5A326A|nr:NAD(P)/FAD-dependent oxidoreductase [Saccharopolyspora soli]
MTSLTDHAPPEESIPPANDVDVLIIGAGFSGFAVAALLSRAGIRSFLILESANDIGGTWRDNTYPGCACDIPAPLYSYSFDQKPDWTQLFARQPEILDYLRSVAHRRGLLEHTRLGQRVEQTRWVAKDTRWVSVTNSGERYRSRFLVCAVGLLREPAYPRLPGIESFGGPIFHSATWRHDVDLTGKRVAVVGTGASAIQFVPAIVDQVAALTVFQRTPPWIVPKRDRPFDQRHRWLAHWLPPYRWHVRRQLYRVHEERATGFVTDPAAMATTAALAHRLLAKQVPDPELRAKLTPDYTIGCKRLLISSDWYPTLNKPHVDLRTCAVEQLGPNTVVGADGGTVDADVLIFGTGFDIQDSIRINIEGADGRTLAQSWSGGSEAYLGTTVAGFPNMFLMAGPNTGLGHNSQLIMIEAQAHYIVDLLRRSRRRNARSIQVRPEVQRSFNQWLMGRMDGTVWQTGGCRSWYQDPRSGRNTVLWPDTTIAFRHRTRRARMSDYLLD